MLIDIDLKYTEHTAEFYQSIPLLEAEFLVSIWAARLQWRGSRMDSCLCRRCHRQREPAKAVAILCRPPNNRWIPFYPNLEIRIPASLQMEWKSHVDISCICTTDIHLRIFTGIAFSNLAGGTCR